MHIHAAAGAGSHAQSSITEADTDGAGHGAGDDWRQNLVNDFLAAGEADDQADDHVDDTRGQEASLHNSDGFGFGGNAKAQTRFKNIQPATPR